MKPEYLQQLQNEALPAGGTGRWRVECETARLTEVMLCPPAHLSAVPCCSVTCENIDAGFSTDVQAALVQHRALRAALEQHGVRCHMLPALAGLPDLCFTRDCAVTTPWGPVLLNPAMPHRRREAEHVRDYLTLLGARPLRIATGTIEGGDVCVAREGLVIVGRSGVRTTAEGAAALAAIFEHHGWRVVHVPFDPHFLHLDTIFCMLGPHHALAYVEGLSAAFREVAEELGIELLPVSYAEWRDLACNVVSLGGRTVMMRSGHSRIRAMLTRAGYAAAELDISQFAACGGGLHCLTMPLARETGLL